MTLGMGELVTIVEYDLRWPTLYEEERARIARVLGIAVVSIEHVGSTAVPGLGAKPIIDIMVGIRVFSVGESCIQPLRSLGYEYRPDDTIPRRIFFRKFSNGVRTHHLHMVELDGDFWERHLLFRDYLRMYPEEARAYHELKKGLAVRFGTDRAGYTDAKTPFTEGALVRARALRAAG